MQGRHNSVAVAPGVCGIVPCRIVEKIVVEKLCTVVVGVAIQIEIIRGGQLSEFKLPPADRLLPRKLVHTLFHFLGFAREKIIVSEIQPGHAGDFRQVG